MYQHIVCTNNYEDLVDEEVHGRKKYKFVSGHNVPLLLQKLLETRVIWKDQLPKDFVKDVINYRDRRLSQTDLSVRSSSTLAAQSIDHLPVRSRIGDVSDEEVLTPEQVAEVMGISKVEVQNLKFPFRSVGATVFVKLGEIKDRLNPVQLKKLDEVLV